MPAKLVVVAHLEGKWEVLSIKEPVPDSSVSRVASSAEVSMEVEETLLLKSVQSAAARQPAVRGEAVAQVRTPAELERPEPVRSEKYSAFKPRVPPTFKEPVVEAEVNKAKPSTVRVLERGR